MYAFVSPVMHWVDQLPKGVVDVYVLNNRTELPNGATARTNSTYFVVQYEGANANSFLSAFILGAAGGPLPIGLGTLAGNASTGVIDLQWSATNEQNNVRYELERKDPGETDFHVISLINGNSRTVQSDYQYANNNVSAEKIYICIV